MKSEKHIKLGKGTTLISFIIGTLIFGLYFLTSEFELLFVGYGFIVLTGIFNLIVYVVIFVKSRKDLDNRKELLNTSGLMLMALF